MVFMILIGRDCREEDHRVEPKIKSLEIFAIKKTYLRILNGDVGGGFQGIQITSGFFQLWRASGITNELQLYATAIGGLVFAALMLFAGWFHYHKAAPKLAWFQNVESMLN